MSISLSANRSFYNGVTDDSAYVSLSFPLSNGANVGYSMNTSRYDTTNRVSYYDRLDDRTNYQVSAGANRKVEPQVLLFHIKGIMLVGQPMRII